MAFTLNLKAINYLLVDSAFIIIFALHHRCFNLNKNHQYSIYFTAFFCSNFHSMQYEYSQLAFIHLKSHYLFYFLYFLIQFLKNNSYPILFFFYF